MIDDMPFEVPIHDSMALRIPGKFPLTVLTVEAMLFSWRICEYSEPLFFARAWWYESFDAALAALSEFTNTPGAEPGGWIRADDIDDEGRWRTRRAMVVDGQRVVTLDEGD